MKGAQFEAPKLTRSRAWIDKAACIAEEGLFDDPDPRAIPLQKAICAACIVRRECLDDAMSFEKGGVWNRHLVWGGLTPEERAELAVKIAIESASLRAADIPHGTRVGVLAHKRRRERVCDECLPYAPEVISRRNGRARARARARRSS